MKNFKSSTYLLRHVLLWNRWSSLEILSDQTDLFHAESFFEGNGTLISILKNISLDKSRPRSPTVFYTFNYNLKSLQNIYNRKVSKGPHF